MSKSSNDLEIVADGALQYIKLNRPKRKNAISTPLYDEITQALNSAAKDPNVNVVVLTGKGDYFSSGNDLGNFMTMDPSVGIEKVTQDARDLLERFVGAFIDFPKFLIVAINGPAIGVGATCTALCDFAYASDKATFHTPFTSLAQTAEACSSYTFPKAMGPRVANDVLVLGRKLNAAEAKQYGLVNEVFPAGEFQQKVHAIAKALSNEPAEILLASKRVIRSPGEIATLKATNTRECDELRERWRSPELMNAVAKFMSRSKL